MAEGERSPPVAVVDSGVGVSPAETVSLGVESGRPPRRPAAASPDDEAGAPELPPSITTWERGEPADFRGLPELESGPWTATTAAPVVTAAIPAIAIARPNRLLIAAKNDAMTSLSGTEGAIRAEPGMKTV